MELVIILIMVMVGFSFALKLTCHNLRGRLILCAPAAVFLLLTCESAISQSKTQIADWLGQPDLMLDTSVWLTIDVAFQICFCALYAKRQGAPLTRFESAAYQICLWFPGILIFPVLFAALTELIFSLPGTDFNLIGRGAAIAVVVLFPMVSYGLGWLIPEKEIRLELLFMINLLIAALGIVATVNGRTAATGTNHVEWTALAGVFAILITGAIAGMACNKYITDKKISKLK